MAAAILIIGGLGGAAFHPPAAALAYRLGADRPGLAMSVHITGGSLGFSLGPLLFAPFAQRSAWHWTPMLAHSGSCRRPALPEPAAAGDLDDDDHTGLSRTAPVRAPARAPLLHRGAADDDLDRICDVHAGPPDQSRDVARRVRDRRGGLSLRQRGGRIPWRARCGSIRRASRHRPVARLRGAVPVPRVVERGLGVRDSGRGWAGSFCSRPCRSTSPLDRRLHPSARQRCRR